LRGGGRHFRGSGMVFGLLLLPPCLRSPPDALHPPARLLCRRLDTLPPMLCRHHSQPPPPAFRHLAPDPRPPPPLLLATNTPTEVAVPSSPPSSCTAYSVSTFGVHQIQMAAAAAWGHGGGPKLDGRHSTSGLGHDLRSGSDGSRSGFGIFFIFCK
jgi:hypothetical protein